MDRKVWGEQSSSGSSPSPQLGREKGADQDTCNPSTKSNGYRSHLQALARHPGRARGRLMHCTAVIKRPVEGRQIKRSRARCGPGSVGQNTKGSHSGGKGHVDIYNCAPSHAGFWDLTEGDNYPNVKILCAQDVRDSFGRLKIQKTENNLKNLTRRHCSQ